jgi:glycine/D-amino acid oxidase-like deaminating enzyme
VDYRTVSLWLDQVAADGDSLRPRPGLTSDLAVDVCIVGAGFSGLWAAYHILRAAPDLNVAVLEAHIAGYGASGRNGGWCSALFPMSTEALARRHGRDAALALRRSLVQSVDEVGAWAEAERIACDYRKGGSIALARSAVQLGRCRADVAADGVFEGIGGLHLLDAEQAGRIVRATGVVGATFTPECARVHPGRLVRGLADVVERCGGRIFEQTRATAISPREADGFARVHTDRGTARAPIVLRTTEAWTARLPGTRRDIAPVYSLMVASEPLPPDVWDQIGLAGGETFTDHRHLIVYGQRTADDRLAFGGRGAPYHFRSRIEPSFDRSEKVHAALRTIVSEMFPALEDVRFTHAWGGPLGVPRDWHPSVGLDRTSGLGWAGGYVGDGVAAANLAGRTLADLVLERRTPLTDLPWVGYRGRRWEPEPLRWLGINTARCAASVADAEESATGHPSLVAKGLAGLIGS